MLRLLVIIVALILMPTAGTAHEYCAKARCEEVRQKMEKIRAKMRQGYTRAQGEKMEAELRHLRAIRSRRCR